MSLTPPCATHLAAWPQIPGADLAGEAHIAADGSMDLFALGILAWEVMTGKRFYGGE